MFILSLEDGDVVSPCSSILVTVQRRRGKNDNSAVPRALDPHLAGSRQLVLTQSLLTISMWSQSTTDSQGEQQTKVNVLSRYRKYGEKWDLEHCVEEFKRTLNCCPQNHPCRAAAQSNLAMAEFTLCQVENKEAFLPLGLYRDALCSSCRAR